MIDLGFLMPHPPVVIPGIAEKFPKKANETVRGYAGAAELIVRYAPEQIIIVTPHNRIWGESFYIGTAGSLKGDLESFGHPEIAFYAGGNPLLANRIMDRANSSGLRIQSMDLPGEEGLLDHGCVVPLIMSKINNVPVVVISISFGSLGSHYETGAIISKVCDELKLKTLFIGSGDMSHKLTPRAPAGYAKEGVEFDSTVRDIFETGQLEDLLTLKPNLIRRSGECGMRSAVMLSGCFDGRKTESEVLSYEAPFGVGYLLAKVEAA